MSFREWEDLCFVYCLRTFFLNVNIFNYKAGVGLVSLFRCLLFAVFVRDDPHRCLVLYTKSFCVKPLRFSALQKAIANIQNIFVKTKQQKK
jgi:hypothetical protein